MTSTTPPCPIRATWSATAATRRMRSGRASARIAVQFVLNYEEGGENCVLHGDAGSEQFLSEMFNPRELPGPPHQHGRHLRVRLARRRLAHPARVREARPAAHGVRRRHGAGALPRTHGRLQGAGPRDRLPRLALDPLPERRRGHRARAHAPGHGGHREAHRRARAGLVHRPRQPAHAPAGGRLRRLRVRQRLLRRRPALLDEGAEDRRRASCRS